MSKEAKIKVDVVQVGDKVLAQRQDATIHTMQKKSMTKAPLPKHGEYGGNVWAIWGKDDRFPTSIRKKIEKVPIAGMSIYKLVSMMYGNGLAYYRNEDLRNGTKIKRHFSPTIEQWLDINQVRERYLPAQFTDYRMYMNAFSEMILSEDKSTITNIYSKPAEFCRLEKQNTKTLNIDFLYYSPYFAEHTNPSSNQLKKIPLHVWYENDKFIKKLRGRKFAWHSRFEMPGTIYYTKAFWNGLFRENGWVDAAIEVPHVVNSMMKNQVILKYQILIPETYFTIRYQDWHTYTDKERNQRIDDLIDDINDSLTGTQNAYTSITTLFKQDPATGKDLGKLEILAIDDKVKKDQWVPSSSVANAEIVQGLGLHPSQMGLVNDGGTLGSGSGSDQRESFNTGLTLNTIDQRIVLSTLNYMARFNSRTNKEWDVTFFIDHTFHTTTNNQESGMVDSDTSLQIEQ